MVALHCLETSSLVQMGEGLLLPGLPCCPCGCAGPFYYVSPSFVIDLDAAAHTAQSYDMHAGRRPAVGFSFLRRLALWPMVSRDVTAAAGTTPTTLLPHADLAIGRNGQRKLNRGSINKVDLEIEMRTL